MPKDFSFNIFSDVFRGVLFKFNKNGFVAITINLNSTEYLQTTLDVLERYETKVAFFLSSECINENNEDLLLKIVKNGHHIYNHGASKKTHFFLSTSELLNEMKQCDEEIKRIYNIANLNLPKNKFFRPVGNIFKLDMVDLCKRNNFEMIIGSVFPHDQYIFFALMASFYLRNHVTSGDIIVLNNHMLTPAILKNLLTWMFYNGYKNINLNDL